MPPNYPIDAKWNHVQGTVVIRVKVSTTGEVSDMQVVSGPLLLQQAALDSVKTWRYKPYLMNGEAVEVESQVNVVFTLGG